MRIPAARIWLLGAVALCAVAASRRLNYGLGEQLRLPATPLDRTSASGAREWAFLQECRDRIPSGASLTVVADDPTQESALFMLALGVFPDHPVLPSSYFGTAVSLGSQADYVLIYGGAKRPDGIEFVHEWADGAIGRRRK